MYEPKFPEYLLKASLEERIAFFENIRTRHALLEPVEQVLEAIWPYQRKAAEHQLHGILYGHTATGKTSFCKNLRDKYPRVAGVEVDLVPVLWFRCPLPFTPKEFYHQGLKAYEAPAPREALWVRDDMERIRREKQTEGALKRRFFELAQRCETKVWIIDEIQHIRYGQGSGYSIERTLDQLKHLADEAGVMLLLAGTYQTLELFRQNTQLTRRFRRMVLDRYRFFNEAEPNDPVNTPWLEVIQSLENWLPLSQPSNLTKCGPALHRVTFGLIGLLKPLLTEALRLALSTKQQTITSAILQKCQLSDRELKEMEAQIRSDERDESVDSSARVVPTRPPSRMRKKSQTSAKPKPRRSVDDAA
ncbi:MAG: TniB family NTP-binding protein [Nitrospira sp.]|nr:TniB family NTP-binding protein [Nitrospira sp.]